MKISVYITSYNQKEFLKEAIESVLAQTYSPYEIVIVDDASTDGSQDLIQSYCSSYGNIRGIFNDNNLGVTQTRIKALSNIKGDYVTYLDGDDLYLPNKLETEAEIIRKENSDLAFSNNMYVDENDPSVVYWIWAAEQIDLQGNLFVKTLSRDFPRNSLFRMELIDVNVLKRIGFHDPNLKIYEDYELRVRMAKVAKMACSIMPTSKIRVSSEGLSKSSKEVHLEAIDYIFNKFKGDIKQLNSNSRKQVTSMHRELRRTYSTSRGMSFKRIIKYLTN
jgi:glycosyltransferase involved in cell wall biosynthesis